MDTIQVLSFNCWGLAVISKNRRHRLSAIADTLTNSSYDIITLQEVWVQKDYDYLVEKLRYNLPHAKFFYSGALGSGLAIFSKFPIIATAYHRYALNGKPLKLLHADYYVGKGCATTTVDHPQLGLLDIYNTHLHGGYGPEDPYKAHRATQCWQLANLLRASAAMGRHIIMSGDFNSVPSSFNYKLIRNHGYMTDSWLQVHGEPDANGFDMNSLNSETYTQYFGFTCNSPYNTFSRYYSPSTDNIHAKRMMGKRLDYIFYSQTPQFTCTDSRVVLTDRVPGTDMSYSDHFGVVSHFTILHHPPSPSQTRPNRRKFNETQLDPTTVREIVDALVLDKMKAKRDADWLLGCFFSCIVLQFILLVIIVAVPTCVPETIVIVLVTLIGSLLMNFVSVALPVCLIVAFVFGRTEERALLQFIQEIETFQQNMIYSTV
ncbi:Endonuclease/exonuclease/phosphatase [Mucor mucedo]|uniref:Endonuclease/exonuclease/phosphatase n=1 Tax=Mucor mucedo TaxID=29922 RepID=UPI00221E9CA1|nr:Endonuclease/exonuclease/phosphatase [Mucor mucedo]KAI7887697.1 Endonuclease/exonuclease/phosphatase [Mucor mucedo]